MNDQITQILEIVSILPVALGVIVGMNICMVVLLILIWIKDK